MFNIIERYMAKMTKNDVNNFAIKNNVTLNEEELNFTYEFVKKNWNTILSNPNLFHMERYKDKYTEENYHKINKLIREYQNRYKSFL